MRVLVTAGNTQAPIDSVRCITNIFTGRTGAQLARFGFQQGHDVVLLTSHPETVDVVDPRLRVEKYRTFEDLAGLMEGSIRGQPFDVIIHCAAVSDYLAAGIYAPGLGVTFDPVTSTWSQQVPLLDRGSKGKVKSDEPELWLRMTRAPKLVDRIRHDWAWKGILIKFKLEVEKSDAELLRIAERSRQQSQADLMVANTLEGAAQWAFLGPVGDAYVKVTREELPARLFEQIGRCRASEAPHG